MIEVDLSNCTGVSKQLSKVYSKLFQSLKMKLFVKVINVFQLLTIIAESSILDV